MSTSPADFNAKIIEEFHASEGRLGGRFEGMPLLLLHHAGARSGKRRVNPLAYLEDDGRYVVFASKAGAPRNPDWYHNLRAHPDVTIEVGTRSLPVRADEATGEERERLYRAQAARVPQFLEYETQTERVIPVMILTPVETA
jgi:deazaflavin-dependent oxidoreductase (nitroreductase family)